MPVSHQTLDRLEQIDRTLLSLLAQRISALEDIAETADEATKEDFGSLLLRFEDLWEQEGRDPSTIGPVAKAIHLLGRNALQ